jgi:hypothetical protein
MEMIRECDAIPLDRAKKTTQVPLTRRMIVAPACLMVFLWTRVCELAPKLSYWVSLFFDWGDSR